MRTAKFAAASIVVLLLITTGFSQELPKPTFNNSVIVSIEHIPNSSAEVDYIKNNFNFGLYAWLSFSVTHIDPDLDWHHDWNDASNGITTFKNNANNYIQAAKNKDVRVHLVLCSGLARGLSIYADAKEEDIRNGQWYNDNKLASDSQIGSSDRMNKYIFGTFSRYARKLRRNLKAKAEAALDFLKQRMDEEPDVLTILSGWGEAEMNYRRLSGGGPQEYFCDYSPFAVLEFRDWIRHEGMYNNISGEYAGQGFSGGGSRYQGGSGLANFNSDFGTSFTTWDLKYYDWNLTDDYDTNPVDSVNNDPNRISYSSYSHGNMMPTSGPDYIAGGFDPPRVMNFGENFWDLWNHFRETMVANFVGDMSEWVAAANIPSERWFSHQIPADYLFGANPSMPVKNERYYSSASPLWSADIQPQGSVGITLYDVKFPDYIYPPMFVRTTQYGLPALAGYGSNTAALEYDPETYPTAWPMTQSSAAFILEQYMKLYNSNIHVINFWRWWDDNQEHRIKGMNKETALKDFVETIRDLSRNLNLNHMYAPPPVLGGSGHFSGQLDAIVVEVTEEIWEGEKWKWKEWGDFDEFEVYRSTQTGFTPNPSNFIGTTDDYSYNDTGYTPIVPNYYRLRAVNNNSVKGSFSPEISLLPLEFIPILSVSRNNLNFGAEQGGASTSPQDIYVANTGPVESTLNWTATPDSGWIFVNPSSKTGGGVLSIGVNISGLSTGTYNGNVIVADIYAQNSPQTIAVHLEVYGAGGSSSPFGFFDTPINGVTVSGEIPVTGWALDDIEVTKVEIKRGSVAGDSPVVIGPDGLVYIGNAVFVKGFRPDVEALYPDYPRNDRAGWGYMMLTTGLPNTGNGTFTIYAFAYDGSGHKVELGSKVIHCDNANRVKPFGTIDFPSQGETVSGADYVNFGWALTPPPKLIPVDGSTIWVWVDGVQLGHPTYNNYREDLAQMFPDHLNSGGAIGYYYLDTTTYSNGIHNIFWTVTDNQGETDGIGSRYFEIQNVGGSGASQQRIDHLEGSEGLNLQMRRIRKGYRQHEIPVREIELDGVHQSREEPIREIELEQLERLELHFMAAEGLEYVGWSRDKSKALPVGSTLDKDKGVFSWIPGPGFLGRFELNFAVTDGKSIGKPVKIVVNIGPKKY